MIVAWPSTAASIPSGWTRETNLDAKYVQGAPVGADADLTTVRGAATHTHTSPAHTPIQNAHSHAVIFGASAGTVNAYVTSQLAAADAHTHTGSTGSVTATNNSVAITVNANSSNDLPYKEVIFIKSDGTPAGIPNGAYAFFASDTLPSGWSRVQGDTYLKGAAAAGDGGGTGGALTHTHTSPPHTHTQNAHTHPQSTSGNNNTNVTINADTGALAAADPHTHTINTDSRTATNNAVTTTLTATNHEPVFKKLNTILNGGATSLPDNIIALWGGTNAGIPSGWSRYTAMDGFFQKGANANGESAVTTGGSTTHTHTASNCQPVQALHNHTITLGPPSALVTPSDVSVPTDPNTASDLHTHSATCSSDRATNQSTTVTIDPNTAESAYPSYARVIFITLTPAVTTVSVNTTYFYNPAVEDIARKPPEVEAAIRRGDRRYMQGG